MGWLCISVVRVFANPDNANRILGPSINGTSPITANDLAQYLQTGMKTPTVQVIWTEAQTDVDWGNGLTQPLGSSLGQLVQDAVSREITDLMVLGGDGLIGPLVNSVREASQAQGMDMDSFTFGVGPLGTGNDFSQWGLGIPNINDWVNRFQAYYQSEERNRTPVDMLRLSLGDAVFHTTYLYGLSVEPAMIDWMNHNSSMKERLGGGIYAVAFLRKFYGYKRPTFDVELTTEQGTSNVVHRKNLLLSIGNTSNIGGGMLVAPGATPYDGMLHVCALNHYVPLVPPIGITVLAGQGIRTDWHPCVHVDAATRAVITPRDTGIHAVSVDGEYFTMKRPVSQAAIDVMDNVYFI